MILARVIDADAALEVKIQNARVRFSQTNSQQDWDRLRELVGQRSPEQVRRMEKERGLQ